MNYRQNQCNTANSFESHKIWKSLLKILTENDLRNVNYSFPLSVDHLFHLSLHPPEIEPLETTLGCWKHFFNKNNNTCVNFFLLFILFIRQLPFTVKYLETRLLNVQYFLHLMHTHLLFTAKIFDN